MDDERLEKARAMRRRVLGAEYVDAQVSDPDPVGREFQDYLTGMAWGVWTREGALSIRDRSLLVMAMTAAMGRIEEFKIHARAQPGTGVTDAEIDELIFQVTAYAGGPAGLSARRAIKEVRAEREAGA